MSLLIVIGAAKPVVAAGPEEGPDGGGVLPLEREQHARALNNQAVDLSEQGRIEEAIASLNEAIRLDPRASLTFYNRGNAFMRRGELDLAIARLHGSHPVEPYACAGLIPTVPGFI